MKRLLIPFIVAISLGATLFSSSSSSFAQGPGTAIGRGGGPGRHAAHGPAIVGTGISRDQSLSLRRAAQAADPQSLGTASAAYGYAVPDSQAERTIEVRPDTRWVNVKRLETVRFAVAQGGAQRAFTWRFDTLPARPFDLKEVAPSGALAQQQVAVYVERNPAYDGGGR